MKRLANKTALITGGAGSIGLITAEKFLAQGAKVILVDLKEEALQQAVASLNSPDVSYITADVTKSSDVEQYAKTAVEKFGKIADLVVFLASDESKFMTGTLNVIDGGMQA